MVNDPSGAAQRPPLALDTPEGIVKTFVRLADLARREGLLSLEDRTEELVGDLEGFAAFGLQCVVDGEDPDALREMLKVRIGEAAARLAAEHRVHVTRLRMLMTGVLAIQAGDAPRAAWIKLESYLAPSTRAAVADSLTSAPPRPAESADEGYPPARAATIPPPPTLDDFTIEHLRHLWARDIERLLREVDVSDLSDALSGASPAVMLKVAGGLSRGTARRLLNAMEAAEAKLPGPREEARRRVLDAVLRLARRGEIVVPVRR